MHLRPFAYALIGLSLLAGCDRRQSDGQSTTPPAEGAASTEPEPTVDATQGEMPATPPVEEAPSMSPPASPEPMSPTSPTEMQPTEPQPAEPQDPETTTP